MATEKKTAVVTGATGQLGRQVVKAFEKEGWEVFGTGFSRAKPPAIRKVDLQNREEVVNILDEVKPKILIHCAANRFPDKCESDPEGVKKLNVEASKMLAEETNSRGIFLIYISTDYVFDGKPGAAPYEADSAPSPLNFYGVTKLAGEKAVLEASPGGGAVVMRVPVLYGEVEQNKESAVNVLLDAVYKAGSQRVEMDHWSIKYPTNTADVARVLKDVAVKYTISEDRSALPKILQFSSEDRMTKYEICQMLAEIAGLPLENMTPNDTNDPNSTVVRPYDCHLSTKALKDLGISVQTVSFRDWWQRSMRAYKH
ncbi:RmlD-like substrate binding domain-containing protein [Tirmania nivea]|nr:RmlD-like substrate binding domain-containing protein [Tirmania nivea]